MVVKAKLVVMVQDCDICDDRHGGGGGAAAPDDDDADDHTLRRYCLRYL